MRGEPGADAVCLVPTNLVDRMNTSRSDMLWNDIRSAILAREHRVGFVVVDVSFQLGIEIQSTP